MLQACRVNRRSPGDESEALPARQDHSQSREAACGLPGPELSRGTGRIGTMSMPHRGSFALSWSGSPRAALGWGRGSGERIRRVSWYTNEFEPLWLGLPLGSFRALLTGG